MTVLARAIRVFMVGVGAFVSLLCTATIATASTQPNLPDLESQPDLGMAPTIATAITIGLVAIATLVRTARNYLNGKEIAKTNGRAQD